jgi:hypothetical protein
MEWYDVDWINLAHNGDQHRALYWRFHKITEISSGLLASEFHGISPLNCLINNSSWAHRVDATIWKVLLGFLRRLVFCGVVVSVVVPTEPFMWPSWNVFDVYHQLSRSPLQNESNSMENKLYLSAILRPTEGHFCLLLTYLWNTINPQP